MTLHEIANRPCLRRVGGGWRGACPSCGYQDALALDVGEGGRPLLWCASCQNREAMGRLLRDLGALAKRPAIPLPPRRDDAARIGRARELWAEARPLTGDDPASRYLRRRRIEAAITSPALRWSPSTPHPGGGCRLALLVRIDDVRGELVGLQRIFLTPAGEKASIDPVKATFGTVAGGAVRLAPAESEVAVAEGVESAAAAGVLLGLPAWAAVSAGNLGRSMALPLTIRSVVIAADHDEAGLRAAEAAARRWRAEGRAVRVLRATKPGADTADLLELGEGRDA